MKTSDREFEFELGRLKFISLLGGVIAITAMIGFMSVFIIALNHSQSFQETIFWLCFACGFYGIGYFFTNAWLNIERATELGSFERLTICLAIGLLGPFSFFGWLEKCLSEFYSLFSYRQNLKAFKETAHEIIVSLWKIPD